MNGFVVGFRIRIERRHRIVAARPQVIDGHVIGFEEGEFRAELDTHVCHGHAAGDGHARGNWPGVLDGAVLRHLGAERSGQVQDHIFRHHAGADLPFEDEADRRRHLHPQLPGGQHVGHFRDPDARPGGADGTVGGAVRIAAENELPGKNEAAFSQHLVADPGVTEKVVDTEALGKITCQHVPARHLLRRRRKVVVQNHNHAFRIEDTVDADLQQLERTQHESFVAHDPIDRCRDVVARSNAVLPGSARQDLLRHRHAHALIPFPDR